MTKTEVETESYYDILSNADGELLFCIKTKEGSPDHPQILFNGEEHALLYRTADQMIVLDYIHPDVAPLLAKAETVLVAEFNDATPENPQKGIIREYSAVVRHVSKLPVTVLK
ncbi:MAG: hypothetical protein MJ247_05995 [Alphaproteobacteria bacterium]|nr:hypothetical protein [Alphaproteobacteria bacterium]